MQPLGTAALAVAGGGAATATAAPTLSPADIAALNTTIILPLCTWVSKLQPPELCFMMSTPLPPASLVTSWTSLCTALYSGLAWRVAWRVDFPLSDGVVALACEEIYNLAKSSTCKARCRAQAAAAALCCSEHLSRWTLAAMPSAGCSADPDAAPCCPPCLAGHCSHQPIHRQPNHLHIAAAGGYVPAECADRGRT